MQKPTQASVSSKTGTAAALLVRCNSRQQREELRISAAQIDNEVSKNVVAPARCGAAHASTAVYFSIWPLIYVQGCAQHELHAAAAPVPLLSPLPVCGLHADAACAAAVAAAAAACVASDSARDMASSDGDFGPAAFPCTRCHAVRRRSPPACMGPR